VVIEMSELVVAILAIVFIVVLLSRLALARYSNKKLQGRMDLMEEALSEKENVPYWLRNWSEDVISPNVHMTVLLRSLKRQQEDVLDFLDRAEWDLERQNRLIGQIRNGEYRKDQPGSPREDSTRGNGI
jgi:hypothetical protein